MPSRKKVHNTHISAQIKALHGALLDIASAMNRPQRDEELVREAGISLDRALFPLLVRIARLGPVGIVGLAECVGRDYTTVSRQVARLEALGLVQRRRGASDRRVCEAIITPKGQAMIARIDAARDRTGRAIFASWDDHDIQELVRLMRKLADALNDPPAAS